MEYQKGHSTSTKGNYYPIIINYIIYIIYTVYIIYIVYVRYSIYTIYIFYIRYIIYTMYIIYINYILTFSNYMILYKLYNIYKLYNLYKKGVRKKMKIITLANQKGGCGKTTTSHTLATGLCNRGYKVLAVDCDPQCNFSTVFDLKVSKDQLTLYDVLNKQADIGKAKITIHEGLDIIQGDLMLCDADRKFTKIGSEFMLKEALEPISDYDFVVIDTAPSLGILTVNALVAADCLIIPMTPDYFSFKGLEQLKDNIQSVKKYCNPKLKVSGLLLTRCDRTGLTGMMKEDITTAAESMGTKVFLSTIRQGVAIRESQFLKSDIFKESPRAAVTQEYSNFIDEFLESEELSNGNR